MSAALVVLGATGKIGRGVVAAAVADGRPVIAVSREWRELRALREEHSGTALAIVRGSVANERSAARLAGALRALACPLGAIVVSICSESERGRVLDQPASTLRRMLDENVLAHANAARLLLPLLVPAAGTYVLIGGPGGEQPWSGYGHRSIVAASLRMLARVLNEEARALAVRVQLLAIDAPAKVAENRAHACAHWPTPEAIGVRVIALVDQREPGKPTAIVHYPGCLDTPNSELRGATPRAAVCALLDTVKNPQLKESSS